MEPELKSIINDAQSLLKEILGFWESGEPIHPRTAETAQYMVERLDEQVGAQDAAEA
tara:strand:- start:584 stop:754 length:171 start_codon:yes stop_codon:yes gene_type:complete